MTKIERDTLKPQQLCWRCRRSYTNKCSWAEEFKPVKGWTAVKTTVGVKDQTSDTYIVILCPLFKDEAPEGQNTRTYYAKKIEENYTALAAAVVEQACKDFVKAYIDYRKNDDECALKEMKNLARWFRSKDFQIYCDLDPEGLIKSLKALADDGGGRRWNPHE